MSRIDELIQLCAQSSMQKSAGMSSVARATRAAEIAAVIPDRLKFNQGMHNAAGIITLNPGHLLYNHFVTGKGTKMMAEHIIAERRAKQILGGVAAAGIPAAGLAGLAAGAGATHVAHHYN